MTFWILQVKITDNVNVITVYSHRAIISSSLHIAEDIAEDICKDSKGNKLILKWIFDIAMIEWTRLKCNCVHAIGNINDHILYNTIILYYINTIRIILTHFL